MSRDTKKLLIVGVKGYERNVDEVRVDCVLWDQLPVVMNIRDYDTILLNLFPLEAVEQRACVDWPHFHRLFNFNATADILLHEGRIIILGDPRFDISVGGSGDSRVKANDVEPFLEWTGIRFHWDSQPGDTVNFKEYGHERFKEFIKHLKSWKYSLDKCQPNHHAVGTRFNLRDLGEKGYYLRIDADLFCENRYQNGVAFRVCLRFSHEYKENLFFGSFLFLPRISLDEDETMQIVLRDICSVETNLLEPEWISQFSAPGQKDTDEKIEQIKTEIQIKLIALDKAKTERADIRKCLKLLYEREFGLEPVVLGILRELGAKVEEPSEKNKEDGWITDYVGKFFGYGRWSAPIWLVGIEEEGGRLECEIERRLEAWVSHGRKDLEDATVFYPKCGNDKWHGEKAVVQPTWGQLIRMLLVAWGEPDRDEAIINYQRELLGAVNGETCLVELLPLPSPSTQDWNYGRWSRLPWLSNRANYMAAIRNERIKTLCQRVTSYKPKAVIFYGTTIAGGVSLLPSWSCIAGGRFGQAVADKKILLERHDEQTAFFVSRHPADPSIRASQNEYFCEIGNVLRKKLGTSFKQLHALQKK